MNAVELKAYTLEQEIAKNTQLAEQASLSSETYANMAQQQYDIIRNAELSIERINEVIGETYTEITNPGTTYTESLEYLQLIKDAKVVLDAFYNAALEAQVSATAHISSAREQGTLAEQYVKLVKDDSTILNELATDYSV